MSSVQIGPAWPGRKIGQWFTRRSSKPISPIGKVDAAAAAERWAANVAGSYEGWQRYRRQVVIHDSNPERRPEGTGGT